MSAFFYSYSSMSIGTLLLFGLLISAFPVKALEPEPYPLDTFLTNILNFKQPTRIRGTLRYVDRERQTIWLNWEERSDERPLFETGWLLVPGDVALEVHPTDPSQFEKLQQIPQGTAIEMVIQLDPERNRRILSYQDLSLVPL